MKRPPSVIFMGTSAFAVPILHALSHRYALIAVVTQPDRPKGRGRVPSPSKVKENALRLGLRVLQPESVRAPDFVQKIKRLGPDLIVVVAFGQILSASLLQIPEMGCINVHASLLPKYRGAAPINRAIEKGETKTGVTTILMDEGMDTGPILLSRMVSIDRNDTAISLEERLAAFGTEVAVKTVEGLKTGTVKPIPQDEKKATYAPSLRKEEGRIDWSRPASVLHSQIRAFTPWPGTFTRMGKKILKIFSAEVDNIPHDQHPGCIVAVGRGDIRVATGQGYLILKELQLEGKRRLPVREFLRGHRVEIGKVFES
jgi:methionyl-tRNA formyltransferase